MTRHAFYALCTSFLISPFFALENENIKQALRDRDDSKVERLLREEF